MSNPYGNDPYGQQPPSNPYGPPGGGSGFNEPAKTDGVSIASLVLGLVCCAPVGLILGFVGLRRTKNGQRKGRGFAITGVVLGLLGLLVWVGLAIAAVAGVAWFESLVELDEAEAGECVDIDNDDGDTVLLYEAECNEEHDGEIVAVADVTDENLEQVESLMVDYCFDILSEEDAAKLAEYSDTIEAVTEDPNDVEVGDHLVCYVEPDDKLDEPIL